MYIQLSLPWTAGMLLKVSMYAPVYRYSAMKIFATSGLVWLHGIPYT